MKTFKLRTKNDEQKQGKTMIISEKYCFQEGKHKI